MLAERDHGVVDLVHLGGRDAEPQRLAASLARRGGPNAGRAPGARAGWPTSCGPHDLVGARVLQHAVLVDAGFVRERVAADDGLVGLDRLVGEAA